jgi:hypothetical protein
MIESDGRLLCATHRHVDGKPTDQSASATALAPRGGRGRAEDGSWRTWLRAPRARRGSRAPPQERSQETPSPKGLRSGLAHGPAPRLPRARAGETGCSPRQRRRGSSAPRCLHPRPRAPRAGRGRWALSARATRPPGARRRQGGACRGRETARASPRAGRGRGRRRAGLVRRGAPARAFDRTGRR